ncbi:30S ribosomal protein S8, partial [candidate division TA06 bacterium]|nr:30S ribosomal protein S8 [candidate division TA06 bacterium]
MSMTDPIADMLTRIRNAGKAKMKRADVPASKMKMAITKILLRERLISNFKYIA